MRVLIVEDSRPLGRLWQRHLQRSGLEVELRHDARRAIEAISHQPWDVIVLDLVLGGSSALAVADYAEIRRPEAKVIVVTNTRFFADGSIFGLSANACAFLRSGIPPEDLTEVVRHHGRVA
ncbi:response regulator [Pelagovum pacificum]|uniref:Response regulator n=1 Tax=Pelagovum pacificum TaxID=2588711 RepID=A0A5C5GFY4_9RHOB|nr:response regulator [Pelagovum pacificum]QQA43191.1 response regulator [Pelagovum pacificum]TNY33668.1 response regulator [Pelagovum pacificum]